MYTLYILYKSNMLSRDGLKAILKAINEPIPENIAKFLVEEGRK